MESVPVVTVRIGGLEEHNRVQTLLEDISHHLVSTCANADVTFFCGKGATVPTNKLLLALCSFFMENILKEQQFEDEVTILLPDFSSTTVNAFLRLASSGELTVDEEEDLVQVEQLLLQLQVKFRRSDGKQHFTPVVDSSESKIPNGTNKRKRRKCKIDKRCKRALPSDEKEKEDADLITECKECSIQFRGRASYYRHRRQQHKRDDDDSQPVCHICCKNFQDMHSMKTHVKNVHMMKERPFQCDQCDAKFKTKGSLQSHAATHSTIKSYICDECGFPTTTKVLLKAHQLTHQTVKKYQCDKCDKSFSFKHAFVSHLRKHTGDQPFQCQECGQSFVSKIHLNRHSGRVHTSSRNFGCTLCGSQFKDLSALRRHVILHSQLKPFVCTHCGDTFKHREAGRRHVRSVHPDLKDLTIKFVPSNTLEELEQIAVKKLDLSTNAFQPVNANC